MTRIIPPPPYRPLLNGAAHTNDCYELGTETFQIVYNSEHKLKPKPPSKANKEIGYDPTRREWRMTIFDKTTDPPTKRQTGVAGAIFVLSELDVNLNDKSVLPKDGVWRNSEGDTLIGRRVTR